MRELTELLEAERNLFEKMIEGIQEQKIAMIERNIDAMNESLLKVERIMVEIEALDEKRHEMFKELKRKYGLDEEASLNELLSRMDGKEREEFVSSISRFLKTLNDLAVELDGMRDMMEFERSYFDFLTSLLGGGVRGTYDRKGSYSRREGSGSLNIRW